MLVNCLPVSSPTGSRNEDRANSKRELSYFQLYIGASANAVASPEQGRGRLSFARYDN